MNIRPQAERDHKLRFLDREKYRRIRRKDDERRERQGKTLRTFHENFAGDALPDAADLKAWVDEFHAEHGEEPNGLMWPYFTKSKSVIVFSNRLQRTVTLQIIKSEFHGLTRTDA